MAYNSEILGRMGLRDSLVTLVANTREALRRRAIYKRTIAELKGLSQRELDDLAISRCMIHRLAYEAAYGK